MTDIRYETQAGGRDVVVRLEGKVVGDIRKVEGGWQYKPKGARPGGVFPTLEACKASLEG